MKKTSKEQMLKACIMFGALAIILVIVIGIILRYQEEGEKNVPFYIAEMNVISTAEGVGKEESSGNRWNMDIFQNNAIYLRIAKSDKAKEGATIKKVVIENIQITKAPKKGTILSYMPNSTEGRPFSYDKNFVIQDNLTYTGSTKSNQQNLEIGNQGGDILFQISNSNIGTYQSNEDGEIVHNGTILNTINATMEEITFDASFDVAIYVENKVYRTQINLNLPTGNIIEEGTSYIEKKDLSDLVYIRSFNTK